MISVHRWISDTLLHNTGIKFILIASLCAFVTSSCGPTFGPDSKAMRVIHVYSDKIKTESDLTCTLYGFRYNDADKDGKVKIRIIGLGYRIDQNLKLPEARTLFYKIVDGLLAHLNSNEKIRDDFVHYPLTYRDLEFDIAFDYEDKGFLKRDDVHSIHISENEITYFIVDKEDMQIPENLNAANSEFYLNFFEKHRYITNKLPEKTPPS